MVCGLVSDDCNDGDDVCIWPLFSLCFFFYSFIGQNLIINHRSGLILLSIFVSSRIKSSVSKILHFKSLQDRQVAYPNMYKKGVDGRGYQFQRKYFHELFMKQSNNARRLNRPSENGGYAGHH